MRLVLGGICAADLLEFIVPGHGCSYAIVGAELQTGLGWKPAYIDSVEGPKTVIGRYVTNKE